MKRAMFAAAAAGALTAFAFPAAAADVASDSFAVVQTASNAALQDVRGIRLPSFGATEVPEASTWAMMLLGFFAISFSNRRRGRNTVIPQAA